MKELTYYDGTVGTPEEVMVPFNDRVHFFGTVFMITEWGL